MKARFVWIHRMLIVSAVSLLAFSNTTNLSSIGVALASAPAAADCSQTAAQASAGAPKQAALQALAPSACPSGLVALWKMEETSGTTFVDSANGHNGSCAGNCPISATGVVSNALTFGSATTITVPASTDFDFALSDSFTMEAWIKPTTACAGDEPVVGRSSANGTDFQWWLGCETGKAELIVKDVNLNLGAAQGTTTIANDGNFHHVVGLRDASTNELRLYVDGALEATTPMTYTAGFGSGTPPIYLGWYKAFNTYHFTGTLDEVAIYNRALTAQEIADHHTRGLAGHGICDILDHFVYLPLVSK